MAAEEALLAHDSLLASKLWDQSIDFVGYVPNGYNASAAPGELTPGQKKLSIAWKLGLMAASIVHHVYCFSPWGIASEDVGTIHRVDPFTVRSGPPKLKRSSLSGLDSFSIVRESIKAYIRSTLPWGLGFWFSIKAVIPHPSLPCLGSMSSSLTRPPDSHRATTTP